MDNPVAEASFDCEDRDGRQFVMTVAIGDRHKISTDSDSSDVGFYIEIEPIMERRRQAGTDSLSALCCCIELVRKALKIFVAHGGVIHSPGSKLPIDLDDFAFQPLFGLLRPQYVDGNPNPYRRKDG